MNTHVSVTDITRHHQSFLHPRYISGLVVVVVVVVVDLTLTHRYNAIRGRKTGSHKSGVDDYVRR